MRLGGNTIFASGVAAVALTVVLGYLFILSPDDPEVAPAPMPSARAALVTRAEGVVEMRAGGGGEWRLASLGTEVQPDSDLRTREGAAALSYGGDVAVEMQSDSHLRVERLDDKTTRIVVKEGLVIADVRPESGRTLQVAAENSDAVAEATDGRVHVLSDGQGNVQAAVTRGQASVTARGKTVTVQAGFATRVQPGKAPIAPRKLPGSLLLKVKWPPDASTSKRRHLVQGTTLPGARVKIGAQVVSADDHGRFRAIVELREGRNEIKAQVIDVAGRVQETLSPTIELDTRAPGHAIETQPDMWKRKTP